MDCKYNRSFTLLEVLVTVAVLATAITFVFRSFATSLSSVRLAQNITAACYLTEETMFELELANKFGLKLPDFQEQKIQNKIFNRKYEIQDTDTMNLKELNLEVSWQENVREKDYSIELTTFFSPKDKK